jgi:hypothetical protein
VSLGLDHTPPGVLSIGQGRLNLLDGVPWSLLGHIGLVYKIRVKERLSTDNLW